MRRPLYFYWVFLVWLAVGMASVRAGENPPSSTTQASEKGTAPKLLSPRSREVLDNGCTDRSDGIIWTFKWSEVTGATQYHLSVMGRTATIPAVDQEKLQSVSYVHKSPQSYVIESSRRGWRWKVRALVDDKWTNWSEERTFDVEPADTDCAKEKTLSVKSGSATSLVKGRWVMRTAICLRSLACWSLLVPVVFGADAAVNGPADNLDQLRTIIDAVDVDSSDAARWAEDAYRTIRANGKNNVRAAYALAVVRIHQRKYTEAAELLDGLTPAEQTSLPMERMRLWLALQLDNKDQAAKLFESLVKRMSSPTERPTELSDTANFLGGLVGMLGDVNAESPLATAKLEATAKAIPAPYASSFRQSQQKAAKRRPEIAAFVLALQGAKPEPERLQAKLLKLKAAELELAAQSLAADAMGKKYAALDREAARRKEPLAKQYMKVIAQGRLQTPGRPKQPTVERSTEKNEKGDPITRGPLYDAYVREKAVWDVADRARRGQIYAEARSLSGQMTEIANEQRARAEELVQLRREVQAEQREVHTLQSELQLLRGLADGDIAVASRRVLHQPAQYELLSFAAEKQRLLKSLDAEKK